VQRTGSRDFALDTMLLEHLGSLLVVLDRQGHILRVNRACEVFTGQAAAEAIGRRFWDTLLLPSEISNAVALFSRLTPDRFPVQREYHWQSHSGELRLITWEHTA
jgi:PAS domain S-box-containing protein